MTIRNLDKLLAPKSVALVGASPQPGSIGLMAARNLLNGGFHGPIGLVNPRHAEIEGVRCVAKPADLAFTPDLAVLATPPQTLPGLAAELAELGARALVVITAGVDQGLRQQLLDAGRAQQVRVLGPNCLGALVPAVGLNASFAHRAVKPGTLAFLSQSGALATTLIDWAAGQDLGLRAVLSLGDMADVDFGDLLDYYAGDPDCTAILMYVEGVTSAAKFMSAARRASRVKPVIAIKAGRHAEAAKAAHSHTGALAGADTAYEAAFRRAGILRVRYLDELFEAAEMIARVPTLLGDRLAILTNGGGAGVLAADSLADRQGVLATLSGETLAALDAMLPKAWSHGNPVDVIGDADAARYSGALEILLESPDCDAILAIYCPTALASADSIAEAVIVTRALSKKHKPLIANWLGADAAASARRRFETAGVPSFETPSSAADGFMQLVRYRRAQAALTRTPPRADDSHPIDRCAAEAVIRDARAANRLTLSEAEGKALLAAYGIPVVETRIVASPQEARAAAEAMLPSAGAVVLKILSDDITHKSDVGGVRLDLGTGAAVEAAAAAMLESVKLKAPQARLRGFTVSPFVHRPRAHELLLGMSVDPTFGPLVMFGAGGTSVEAVADAATALPPLDMSLADDLIRHTRVFRLLQGYRDRPAADLEAIKNALVRLAALVAERREIAELDVNPLIADDAGVIALDARVRLIEPHVRPTPTAIKPYPSELIKEVDIADVGRVVVRPIRPEDETLYDDFFSRVTMADRRLRFFAPVGHLSHKFVARLTQIDYARELALIAIDEATGAMLGVVRYVADPDFQSGEYGALVRSDLKGKGLGWIMMTSLIDAARAAGLRAMEGLVLEENTMMLKMCAELGFVLEADAEPGLVKVKLALAPPLPAGAG